VNTNNGSATAQDSTLQTGFNAIRSDNQNLLAAVASQNSNSVNLLNGISSRLGTISTNQQSQGTNYDYRPYWNTNFNYVNALTNLTGSMISNQTSQTAWTNGLSGTGLVGKVEATLNLTNGMRGVYSTLTNMGRVMWGDASTNFTTWVGSVGTNFGSENDVGDYFQVVIPNPMGTNFVWDLNPTRESRWGPIIHWVKDFVLWLGGIWFIINI